MLSRNGRYVLLSSSIRPDFIADRSGIVTVVEVDLATGTRTPYQGWAFGSPVAQQVADDGTVLLSTPRDWPLDAAGHSAAWASAAATG